MTGTENQRTEALESDAASHRGLGRLASALFATIVVLGLALRLWGIGWSLPDARHPLATYHPDELVNLNAARQADISHLQFDIKFYNYGTFYFYLTNLAQTIGSGYGAIPKPPETSTQFGIDAARQNAGLFLAGRLVTALLGTATIAVLFALGTRLHGRRTGLAAALLYAITPIAALHAHFLTVDVPATFFVTLALLYAVRLSESGAARDYALAGLFTGLAAATKYNTALVIIAPIVGHLIRRAAGRPGKHEIGLAGILLGACACAFLIACPGPWLNPQAFWSGIPNYPGSGVYYELFVHSREGHGYLFVHTGPGWWYHLVVTLRSGLGLPLELAALLGAALLACKRRRIDAIMIAFFLLYFGITGLSAVRFARYMIPLVPVLCIWAARLLTASDFRWALHPLYRLAAALVIGMSAAYSITLVHTLVAPDPRDVAADYLTRIAPEGASIAFATVPWYYSPPLSPYFGAPSAPVRARAATATRRFTLRIPGGDWDSATLTPPPDYVLLSNLETMNPLDRLRIPPAVNFVNAIPVAYHQLRFTGPGVLDDSFPASGYTLPEDMLYTRPIITIYKSPALPQ